MKKNKKNSTTITIAAALAVTFTITAFILAGPMTARAASPAKVNLGAAGNFTILSKTGISTTGNTSVTGDIGLSPAAASYITGFALTLPAASAFSTAAQITGKVYASDYANPTPANLTTAVLNMQTAYTDAAGRAPDFTELGAGNIGGMTLAPGAYKWGTGVIIPTDVILSGSANDVWIFQIAQTLTISSGVKVILSGGAQASNIFWQVAGQTTIGTTAVINGNILDQTAIVLNTGAQLNGRALAQTAVTLDANSVSTPASVSQIPDSLIACSNLYWFDNTNKTCQSQKQFCAAYMYLGLQTFQSQQDCLNAVAAEQVVPPTPTSTTIIPNNPVACTMEAKICPNGSSVGRSGPNCEFAQCPETNPTPITLITPPASVLGQQVKAIAINLGQGHKNTNVKTLQEFLISQNIGSAAKSLAKVGATSYFGVLTRAALAEFQLKVGIKPAWGNFGPITRGYLSANF